ncbi:MAG TPA: hypothetical protein VFW21_04195 [Mycobacterium sp.]|nr:hypothetical protein [Mycobacterium sp.]
MGAVGGCTAVTGGNPTVNGADAPAYRTSVSVSAAESAASSSSRESERQAAMTTEVIHTACETMSTSSADAIDAVNTYVDAMNGDGGGDPATVETPAAEALNSTADLVAGDARAALPADVRDALSSWVDAARAAAAAVTAHQPPAQFNAAIRRLNDTRSEALNLCDAHY